MFQDVWSKKFELARKAKEHTDYVSERFQNEINTSIEWTKTYRGNVPNIVYNNDKSIITRIELVNLGSVDAIFAVRSYPEGYGDNIAVLNFASYKNPGGMFLKGSAAQEEALCHRSVLYNVLSNQKEYYKTNMEDLNNNLYTNAALYSPQVLFFNELGQSVTCDVITCAAPNIKSYVRNVAKVDEFTIKSTIESRIKFILDIAYVNKVDTVILGAWGCGVFGNQAKLIAETFCFAIGTMMYADVIKHVIFAVPKFSDNDPNYNAFYNAVDDYNRRLLGR